MHATSKARKSLGNPRAYKGFRLVDPLALIPLCWTVGYGRPIGFRWLHLHLILEDNPTQAKWLEISRDTYPWAKDDETILKDSFFDTTKRWYRYHNKSGLVWPWWWWYVLAIIDPNGKSLNRHNHQPSRNTSPAGFHHLGDVALIQLHGGIVEVSIFRFVDIWMPQKLFASFCNLYLYWKVFVLAMTQKTQMPYNAFTSFFSNPPPLWEKTTMPIYTSKRVCLLIFSWSWMTRFRQKVPDIIPLCFQVGPPPKWPCENCSYRFSESSSHQLMASYFQTSVGGTHVWEHRFNQVFVSSWWFFTTHLKNILVELDHFPVKIKNFWNHHLYRKFGGFQTRYLKEFSNCQSFLNQKFPKISSKRLEKDHFSVKKTRKTYSPGTQTQKLRTSWDEESKLHLKNGLFHVLPICQLKAKDLAPVTQTNIITSCRVAKHHWNKRAGLVMRSPHSRFSKRFTGCFMNLLTSWSNHLVILYNNCSQWNITIFAWKIPSKTGPWLSAAKRALRGTLRKQLFVSHSPILQSYIAWVFADRRVVSCCFNSLHKWFETLQLPEKLR